MRKKIALFLWRFGSVGLVFLGLRMRLWLLKMLIFVLIWLLKLRSFKLGLILKLLLLGLFFWLFDKRLLLFLSLYRNFNLFLKVIILLTIRVNFIRLLRRRYIFHKLNFLLLDFLCLCLAKIAEKIISI